MKDKIEINQSDLLVLLVDKINFLTTEYRKLHASATHKRGNLKIDPIEFGESYEKFLKEEGDINRLLAMYQLFFDDKKPEKTSEIKK